jgi:hypothetical protein
MEAMLGISLYSYPYLNLQKHYVLLIAYVFSSTKLEEKPEQFLPGSRAEWGEGWGRREKWPKQCMHI